MRDAAAAASVPSEVHVDHAIQAPDGNQSTKLMQKYASNPQLDKKELWSYSDLQVRCQSKSAGVAYSYE